IERPAIPSDRPQDPRGLTQPDPEGDKIPRLHLRDELLVRDVFGPVSSSEGAHGRLVSRCQAGHARPAYWAFSLSKSANVLPASARRFTSPPGAHKSPGGHSKATTRS